MKKFIHGSSEKVVALLNDSSVKDGKYLIKTFSPEAYRSVYIANKFATMLLNNERSYEDQDILEDAIWNNPEVELEEDVYEALPSKILNLMMEDNDIKELIDYYYTRYVFDDEIFWYIEKFIETFNTRKEMSNEELISQFEDILENDSFSEAFDWLKDELKS